MCKDTEGRGQERVGCGTWLGTGGGGGLDYIIDCSFALFLALFSF